MLCTIIDVVLYESNGVILLLLNNDTFTHVGGARGAIHQSPRLVGSSESIRRTHAPSHAHQRGKTLGATS